MVVQVDHQESETVKVLMLAYAVAHFVVVSEEFRPCNLFRDEYLQQLKSC